MGDCHMRHAPFSACRHCYPMFPGRGVFRFDHRGVFLEYGCGSRPLAYVFVPEQAPSSSMTAAQASSSSMAEDQAPSSGMTAIKSKKRLHQAVRKDVTPKVAKSTKCTMSKRMLKAVMALKVQRILKR
jgi:hypothetical protein